jgi:hypothetical protein
MTLSINGIHRNKAQVAEASGPFIGFKTNSVFLNESDSLVVIEVIATYLSPSESKELLVFNTKNRTINRRAVEEIKADIRDGRWRVNGDTIVFAIDSDGNEFLSDGQTRLTAIAEGTISVPVIIVRNVAADSTDLLDQQRNRAVRDILKMKYGHEKVANVNDVQSIARLLMEGSGAYHPKTREVAAFADKNLQKLTQWASWANQVSENCQRILAPGRRAVMSSMPASSLGALAIHMVDNGGDAEFVKDFFDRLATGTVSELDKSNVIQSLRKRQMGGVCLSRVSLAGSGAVSPLLTEFATYITAFNRWVLNERVDRIQGQKVAVKNFDELPRVVGIGQ